MWIKFLIMASRKHFIPGIDKKGSKDQEYPFKLMDKSHPDSNKNYSEKDGH